jgi:KDO2-lipid IV(A) lauroyltransferase
MSMWGHLFKGVGLSRFLQWRFSTVLMRWLPFKVSHAYLCLLGRIYYFLNRAEKEQIEQYLSAVIRRGYAGAEHVDLIGRRTFVGIFSHYHEKLFTAYAGYQRVCRFLVERVKLNDQYLLDEALSLGRGLILVTGHFGGVEFLPSILALKGYTVTMMVRFKTARLRQVLTQRAKRVGLTLLDAEADEAILFNAFQALKANQILITECDEFETWRPDRKRGTRFLGCPSPVDRSLDLLQRRYGSPVVMGIVRRQGDSCYGVKFHSLTSGGRGQAVQSIGERALQVLESYIYEAPEQWYQWKQIGIVLGTRILEESRPILASETDRPLSVADPVLHAHQA